MARPPCPTQICLLTIATDQRCQRRSPDARPLGHRLAHGHIEQAPPLVEPLEPEQSLVDEPPRPLRLSLLPNYIRYEDLTAHGLGRDPGHHVHRLPGQLTIALADLPDMDADTDPGLALRVRSVVLLKRMLDADSAPDCGDW
jgi:hypothetical protein